MSRIATNNDYNRYNFSSNAPAVNNRKFQTARIDYNLTEKHHVNFVWNYQVNDRTPDGLNLEYAHPAGHGHAVGFARPGRPVRPQLDGKHRAALGAADQHHQRADGRHSGRSQRFGRRAFPQRLRNLERTAGAIRRGHSDRQPQYLHDQSVQRQLHQLCPAQHAGVPDQRQRQLPERQSPGEHRLQLHPGERVAGGGEFLAAQHTDPGAGDRRSGQYRRHLVVHHHYASRRQRHATERRRQSVRHRGGARFGGHQFVGAGREHQNLRSEFQRGSRPHARIRCVPAGHLARHLKPDPDRRCALGPPGTDSEPGQPVYAAGIRRAVRRLWRRQPV